MVRSTSPRAFYERRRGSSRRLFKRGKPVRTEHVGTKFVWDHVNEVDLSRRLLRVLRDERVVLETKIAVGAAGSPTPIGNFAITDKFPGRRLGSVYGCCVLVLSGHQPRPPRGWAAVDYRLAIHGGDGRTIGRPISAGCVHVRAATLSFLMNRLPAGTPVLIHP